MRWPVLGTIAGLMVGLIAPIQAQDVNEAHERAMKATATTAAPWVVKIETSGGREVLGGGGGGAAIRKGIGPTTGIIVDPAGYIISSAFNFANNPTDIFVTIPGKPRMVGKRVADDKTRMLTLLKVDATGLPVPTAFPKSEIKIGQWALALGRTLDPEIAHLPSMSPGIISATGRIFGKAIQTDAKVSPVNYGGPLMALDGRVFGVLVPASQRGDNEVAGVEWYDSGIGFAIPLEDVLAVLPKLKEGKELKRGVLGIFAKEPNELYNVPVTVGTIADDSAAARAGIKPDDQIVGFEGKTITNFSQLQHLLGSKYAGDTITLKILRDGKEQTIPNIVLSDESGGKQRPFLGILPIRDDPEPGVEIRYVYPGSPADKAGLKVGDRLQKIGPGGKMANGPLQPIPNRGALDQIFQRVPPGTEFRLEVRRKGGEKPETINFQLGTEPESLLAALTPLPSTKAGTAKKPDDKKPEEKKPDPKKPDDKKPEENKAAVETGLLRKTNPTLAREYWVYVPENYSKAVPHGLIIWLHAANRGGKDADDVRRIWQTFCEEHHYIIVGPKSKSPEGWVASETEEIIQDIQPVLDQYTVDRNRVIAHGMGIGGQMAYYLAFNARSLIRGVAISGGSLSTQPKDPSPSQPLSFFIIVGQKDPLIKDIADGVSKLKTKKYPVIYREIAEFGKEYLDSKSFDELQRWIDSIDRL